MCIIQLLQIFIHFSFCLRAHLHRNLEYYLDNGIEESQFFLRILASKFRSLKKQIINLLNEFIKLIL